MLECWNRWCAAALVLFIGGAAHAHDTWFAPVAPAAETSGPVALELGTGTRFPLREFPQSAKSVARMGCTDGQGHAVALHVTAEQPHWLTVQADAAPPLGCWAELHVVDIDLSPEIVQIYLRDIHASDAVRQAWEAQRARGITWHEHYRKSARIELGTADRAIREPVGLALEAVVVGDAPVRAGEPLVLRVLRSGQPLPGFWIEFVSERSPVGIWRQADAQGEVSLALPFAGRWLARGTLLWPDKDEWRSDFVTLALSALPKATQPAH